MKLTKEEGFQLYIDIFNNTKKARAARKAGDLEEAERLSAKIVEDNARFTAHNEVMNANAEQ